MKLKVFSRVWRNVRLSNFLVTVVFLVSASSRMQAAVINAASGSYIDVKAAIAKASPGDTVVLPAGTNGWPALMIISGITLQGAGTNSTVIRDETPLVSGGNGNAFLQISAQTNVLTRVTQIQFAAGVTNNISTFGNNYGSEINVYGGGANWRIDHCAFNLLSGKNILVAEDSFGVIDHNNFITSDRIAVEVFGAGYGDADWAAPTQYGSSNAVYIEDNNFKDYSNFGWVDVSNGGRAVYRHNTSAGYYVNTHGTETSQRFRSCRYVEVYNNNATWGALTNYQDLYTFVDIRGGSALVYSNTAAGFNSIATLHYFRATDNDTAFTPFFGATGISGWDSNGPALLTGTASVTSSSVLTVNGANWANNQWVGYTVYNYGNNLMGVVSGNTANTMSFQPSRTSIYQVHFNAGDSFTVHWIASALDAPGQGQSDLLTGDYPTPIWLHQQGNPIYIWSNALFVVHSSPGGDATPSAIGSPFPTIGVGTNLINSVKPGYTPFTYPHPLTLGTNVVVPAAVTLLPPSGLDAHGF